MSNNSVNPQELLVEYEYLREEVAGIDEQIRSLQEHHASLVGARESIFGFKGANGSELFIPCGAGVYFNSVLNNDSSFLINVGSNVIIEMPRDKAEKVLSERVDQVLSMIVRFNEDADNLVNRMHEIELLLQQVQ